MMLRAVALLACMLLACEPTLSSGKGVTAEQPTVTPKASGQTASGDDSTREDPVDQYRNGELFRVTTSSQAGLLLANTPKGAHNPSEYCLDDGQLWQGAAYRLNETNVFGMVDTDLLGKTVILYGQRKRSLADKLVPLGPCPEGYGEWESTHEMRLDWTSLECGYTIGRSTFERLEGLSYLDAEAVFELDFGSITKGQQDATLSLRNPFDLALTDFTLRAHYEPHKKGTPIFVEQLVSVAAGERVERRVALAIETPKDGDLHSLDLLGTVGNSRVAVSFLVEDRDIRRPPSCFPSACRAD